MAMHVTNKSVKEGCANIVSAGYCSLHNLLYGLDKVAYTTGVYGWNYDVYQFNGITVCTGYRGMPGPTAPRIEEFEEMADGILRSGDDWEMQDRNLEMLRREFAKACMDMLYPEE